jgi:hypothetical protein
MCLTWTFTAMFVLRAICCVTILTHSISTVVFWYWLITGHEEVLTLWRYVKLGDVSYYWQRPSLLLTKTTVQSFCVTPTAAASGLLYKTGWTPTCWGSTEHLDCLFEKSLVRISEEGSKALNSLLAAFVTSDCQSRHACLSSRNKHGSHWTEFRNIVYRPSWIKSVDQIQV